MPVRAEPTGTTGSDPLDPSQAVAALEDAVDREQVFALLLRAARSRTRFAALLSVHADHFRGRRAIADDGFDRAAIDGLRIPRAAVPALEAAVQSGTPYVGPIATGERAADVLLARLGGLPPSAMVLPLVLGRRTIAVVIGHRGDAELAPGDVDDLVPVVAAMAPILTRMLESRAEVAAPRASRRASTEGLEITYDALTTQRLLVDKLRKAEAWEDLADAIRGLIRLGVDGGDPDEDEQLELLYELGRIEADRLGRPELALEAWRGAQTIDASDARVLDALEAVFVQQGRWDDCIELTEKRAVITDSTSQRINLLLNVASLARDRLDDDERAVQAYEKILQWQPEHELAQRQLEELYTRHERWQPLAGLLLDRASRHADPRTRVEALESVARMYEDKVRDSSAAALVWLAVLRREPARTGVMDQIERLAGLDATWDEVIPDCEALAGELEAGHPAAAADIWLHAARWRREQLSDRDGAVTALEHAARLRPGDRAVAAELVEIRRIAGPWVELAAALARSAELEPEPHRSELYAELGEVHEQRLGQAADAITAYQRAIHGDPNNVRSLVALRGLYRQIEDWGSLADILAQLHEALGGNADRDEIVELHVERGQILAEHLGRADDAVNAYKEALALDPRHAPAFHGLEQVFHTTGQTEELLITTEAEVDAGGAPEAHRYADLASAWDDLVGDHDRAAACWRKLLAHDPANPVAHPGLARSLRKAAAWPELAAAHRDHLDHVTSPGDRVALLIELADLLDGPLADLPGAIAVTREAVAIDPNTAALDVLADRYDRGGHAAEAIGVLEQLLAAETDPVRRADRLQRIGAVHANARDRVKARAAFEQAIALDPDQPAAHEGMARIHLAGDDSEARAAGDELVRAAQLYPARADQVRCLTDAAWLYRGRLGDDDRARELLRQVLELDPGHRDAKQALAEVLQGAGQWDTLWPHLEQEVAHARADAAMPADKRLELYLRAARCAVEVGKHAAALELYDLAAALDPGSLAIAFDRADALYRGAQWEAATKAYQTLLVAHVDRLAPGELGLAYRRLGAIHDELGKTNQAIAFHQKAIDADPTNHESLEALVELHLARARFDEAIGALRALVDVAPDHRRAAALERMGDLYHKKLANPGRATSSYLQALEHDGANRRVLQKLLDLQSDSGQWKPALETIDRFLALETEPARRGAYRVASGTIRQEKLKDDAGALAAYEDALDDYFSDPNLTPADRKRALAAFGLIDELVTAARDWKYQEQAYRRMIKRLGKDDPLLITLWHALGEVYRSRLRLYESAVEAFEVAHSLDPDKSAERGRILAELYSLVGIRNPVVATDRAAKLVEVDPDNADAYRALAKTSLEAGRVDEAWCACRALVSLRVATAAEEALYRRHQALEARKATGILDDEAWSFVRHPDEDILISSIFALTWDGPVALRAGPPKSFDLKAKDRMQVEGESRVIAKIFRHAARVLNAPLPDVYVQPRRAGRLLLANCVEKGVLAPAVIVGRDLMKGYRDTELAFAVGSMIALMRPAYYLRLAYPSALELEAALAAAARVVGVKIARPELEPQVAAFAAAIEQRLGPHNHAILAGLARRLSGPLDLARWMHAVDAAARRAALLVCGDLAAAARMVAAEPAVPGGPRSMDKVRDLVAYSVSSGYFAARRHIGVAIS